MGCYSKREDAWSVKDVLVKKSICSSVRNAFMDTRHLQDYLKSELNQQSAQVSESEYANKLVVKVKLSRKKRHTQTKCTVDGGRVLHIYKSSFWQFCNQTLYESSVMRWHQIKHRPYMKTQPLSLALWKHAANCVWQIESILQWPLPSLCKISFPASFSCLPIVDTQVSHFLNVLQTQKESSDIYWAWVYLYSISSFTACRLLWAHSGETLKKLILY